MSTVEEREALGRWGIEGGYDKKVLLFGSTKPRYESRTLETLGLWVESSGHYCRTMEMMRMPYVKCRIEAWLHFGCPVHKGFVCCVYPGRVRSLLVTFSSRVCAPAMFICLYHIRSLLRFSTGCKRRTAREEIGRQEIN